MDPSHKTVMSAIIDGGIFWKKSEKLLKLPVRSFIVVHRNYPAP